MPSIIEGYNYDIFISYRQKDNKGDRWVSEFEGRLPYKTIKYEIRNFSGKAWSEQLLSHPW
jgi:hypothetical protein